MTKSNEMKPKLNRKYAKGMEEESVHWKDIFEEYRQELLENVIPQPKPSIYFIHDKEKMVCYEVLIDGHYFNHWLAWFLYSHLKKDSDWLSRKLTEIDNVRKEDAKQELRKGIKELARKQYEIQGGNQNSEETLEEIEERMIEALQQ